MVNQRLGTSLLSLIVVISLISGLIGGLVGAVVVLRLANTQTMLTVLAQLPSPTPFPFPTPTQMRPMFTPSLTPAPPTPAMVMPAIELTTIEVVERAQPSVVTVINVPEEELSGIAGGEPKSLGSGVILDADGHIVTNYHVVQDLGRLRVILMDGTELDATVVGTDEFTDLAVTRVDSPGLVPATLGDSSLLRVGERVIAIGSALGGFRNTVTVGVISGLGRQVTPTDKEYALEDLIQTDAAINHGNSGGPLLNLRGEVIGINSILIRRERDSEEIVEGIGFSIPSNTVLRIVREIIDHGYVVRPYLGAVIQSVTPQVKATFVLHVDHGARVQAVVPGSPAERAGLHPGDVIVAINDEVIDEQHPFLNVLMHHQVGEIVKLLVNRVGEELTLEATLEHSPAPEP